jgi:hypothetical protein
VADALYTAFGSPYDWEGTPAFTSFTMNGATDQTEWVFAAENDGSGNLTITKLGFRYGARVGTPPTFIISLQGVNASGDPDGTIKGGASPVSATFTPPASVAWNGTWQWVTLDNAYTAAPGELLAIVIAYSSGTIDGSNSSSFSVYISNASSVFPYAINNDAGARTRMPVGNFAVYGYATASKAYGRPIQSVGTVSLQSASSPAEAAMRFTLPAGWSSVYQVGGSRLIANCAAANTMTMKLYSGGGAADTTVLQDVPIDTDAMGSASARPVRLPFDETTLSTLNFGDTYRLAVASGGAVNVTVSYIEVAAAADWDAWPGGQVCYWSQRDAGGNWTDTTTRKLLAEVILADMTKKGIGALVGGSLAR